jgi:hypothetical protein
VLLQSSLSGLHVPSPAVAVHNCEAEKLSEGRSLEDTFVRTFMSITVVQCLNVLLTVLWHYSLTGLRALLRADMGQCLEHEEWQHQLNTVEICALIFLKLEIVISKIVL